MRRKLFAVLVAAVVSGGLGVTGTQAQIMLEIVLTDDGNPVEGAHLNLHMYRDGNHALDAPNFPVVMEEEGNGVYFWWWPWIPNSRWCHWEVEILEQNIVGEIPWVGQFTDYINLWLDDRVQFWEVEVNP